MSKFAPKIKPKLKQMYKSFLFLFSHFVVFQPFKDSAFVHSVFQSLLKTDKINLYIFAPILFQNELIKNLNL